MKTCELRSALKGRHSLSPPRDIRPEDPAQIWLTNKLSDFDRFWPRSNELKSARCYPFQCADILDVRCNTMAAARNTEVLFAAVVDAQTNPLMLLPLGIERRSGVRILSFLDGGLSDYNAPIVFPGTQDWNREQVRVIWQRLCKILPSFDIALFERMPERIGDLPNPLIFLGTSPFPTSGHAASLSGTWDEFSAKRLPGRRRRDNRRLRRRLEERGNVTLEIATTTQQSDAFLEALIRQKVRRHRETLTVAGFDQLGYRNFVMEATRRFCAMGPVHLAALKSDDTIVAVSWGFVFGSHLYGLIESYEGDEWRAFAPGHLLVESLIQWGLAHGVEVYDFGVGDEDYKLEYCDLVTSLHLASIPVTLKGMAYSLALKSVDSLKRQLKHTRAGNLAKSMLRGRGCEREATQRSDRAA